VDYITEIDVGSFLVKKVRVFDHLIEPSLTAPVSVQHLLINAAPHATGRKHGGAGIK
jgi:hypothetical protein